MIRALAVAAILLPTLPLPVHAQAAVQRCVTADGRTIYTDRSCGAFDARPAGPRDGLAGATDPSTTMGAEGAVGGFSIRGCARSPDALLHGVRGALQARDVNRLANYYHWSGTGSSAATALMNRLEHLVEGPSGDVELLYAASPAYIRTPTQDAAPARAPATGSPWWPMSMVTPSPAPPADDRIEAADAAVVDAAAPAQAAVPTPPPIGLRVDVARDDGTGGFEAATFALRQNAGCWFIQF